MLFIMPLTNLLFIMHLTNLLFVELHDGLSEVLDMRIFGDFSHDLSAIQMVRRDGVEIGATIRLDLSDFAESIFLKGEIGS